MDVGDEEQMKNKQKEAPRTTMVNDALGFKWAERRRDSAYKPDL